jgi:thymidylate synthase (FAD)
MNKFLTYNDSKIEIVQCTPHPAYLVAKACALTQKQDISKVNAAADQSKLIHYLFTANHTSPFEHAIITFLITNVSRSFLAQITRHRMGSFTSASQHYQKYDTYPNILDPRMVDMEKVISICDDADWLYQDIIELGIPKEEARQVLPNAKAVNILWTVNARSLINFFNQRLCKRNVQEMRIFAEELVLICTNWFPELFSYIGPDCVVWGGCTQGRMKSEECKNAQIPDFER